MNLFFHLPFGKITDPDYSYIVVSGFLSIAVYAVVRILDEAEGTCMGSFTYYAINFLNILIPPTLRNQFYT